MNVFRKFSAIKTVLVVFTMLALGVKTYADDVKHGLNSYTVGNDPTAFIESYQNSISAALAFSTNTYKILIGSLITECQKQGLDPASVFQPSRWICVQCGYALPAAYAMKVLAPQMQVSNGGVTAESLVEFAETGKCPKCSGGTFCILTEVPASDAKLVTAQDLQNIKEFYRLLAMGWWKNRSGRKVCARCNGSVCKGEGYVHGNWEGNNIISHRLLCDKCIDYYVSSDDLPRLQENPNYYGYGKIEKARLFAELMPPTPKIEKSFRQQCRERYERLL